jgi:hypothetical protein
LVPTLFFGRPLLAAIAAPPPRTRNTASVDIKFAYVSRFLICLKRTLLGIVEGDRWPFTRLE